MSEKSVKPRARDLGLPFEGVTGEFNAITDVAGVEVGFTTLIQGEGAVEVGQGPIRTGVSAILPRGKRDTPSPIWAGHYNLNGNGEMTGTHWIHEAGYFISPICITNTHSVGMVHHATVGWMIDQYPGFFLDEFKGGTGTASRRVKIGSEEYTVGILVQSNLGSRKDLNILGVPVGKHWPENAVMSEISQHETGSIIVIIGTDIPMLPNQLRRVAKRAAIGIGRTGTPGGNYSGDIFLAFSVANDLDWPSMHGEQPAAYALDFINDHYFDDIYRAVVQAIEEAIVNAMIAAESMTTVKPEGYTLEAINHNRLKQIMGRHNCLLDS